MPLYKYGTKELNHLKKCDPHLKRAIERIGKIKREVSSEGLFESLAYTIISQQISGKAAMTVCERFRNICDPLTPEAIVNVDIMTIKQCGMSLRKATYIKGIAEAALAGKLDEEQLIKLSDDELVKELSCLKGIGPWSAEMLLIFTLKRPDIVSWGDLGIRRGMMNLYGLKELDQKTFRQYRERYSPYGTLASFYLWELASETPQQ